jgi:hypothetical protein
MIILIRNILIASCCLLAARPKFKHVDRSVPIYISVSGLDRDEEDSVSKQLKDSLTRMGFKVIPFAQKSALMKQYFEDAKQNVKLLKGPESFSQRNIFENVFARGTASQSINLIYSATTGPSSLTDCDSIGFTLHKLPPRSMSQASERMMWPVADAGPRTAQNLASFLLKKL